MTKLSKASRAYPADFVAKVKDEICERIAEGEPLRVICREPDKPGFRTVYQWLQDDDDFAARFARARDIGFDAIAEEALEISNTPVFGEEIEDDGERVKVRRADMLGHRRLQVETRLKLLAKWSPKKYGELVRQEVSGVDGGPIQSESKVTLDPSEAYKRMVEGG